ncbi:MAG: HK97 gp10 family phage protein [Nitratireductor rhodophyticola]
MAQSFKAQVAAWVAKSERRLEAVFKESTQRLVSQVIDRTPVDTGYLRASLQVTLDGPLPIRPDGRGMVGENYRPPDYALKIAGAELGDTIYASFVASYAAHVEYGARGRSGRGMVRLSVQSWQQIVDGVVRDVQMRIR